MVGQSLYMVGWSLYTSYPEALYIFITTLHVLVIFNTWGLSLSSYSHVQSNFLVMFKIGFGHLYLVMLFNINLATSSTLYISVIFPKDLFITFVILELD